MLAVLLMAHGTPRSIDEMPQYLRLVRGGREPSPALVTEMQHIYTSIGGRSPLTERTLEQSCKLQGVLNDRAVACRVFVGMRNWHPFIADAVTAALEWGATRIVAIPLAPQYSSLSTTKYLDALRAAVPPQLSLSSVDSFHDEPLLAEAFAERIRQAAPAADEEIIFSAHSLPARVVVHGDPYAAQFAETARLTANAAGLTDYHLVFQSAGRTEEPWLDPDINTIIAQRAAGGARRFLVVPVSFVCDHSEILYDIDIKAADTARQVGATLRRVESLNTSPIFIRLLADLVQRHA